MSRSSQAIILSADSTVLGSESFGGLSVRAWFADGCAELGAFAVCCGSSCFWSRYASAGVRSEPMSSSVHVFFALLLRAFLLAESGCAWAAELSGAWAASEPHRIAI